MKDSQTGKQVKCQEKMHRDAHVLVKKKNGGVANVICSQWMERMAIHLRKGKIRNYKIPKLHPILRVVVGSLQTTEHDSHRLPQK